MQDQSIPNTFPRKSFLRNSLSSFHRKGLIPYDFSNDVHGKTHDGEHDPPMIPAKNVRSRRIHKSPKAEPVTRTPSACAGLLFQPIAFTTFII